MQDAQRYVASEIWHAGRGDPLLGAPCPTNIRQGKTAMRWGSSLPRSLQSPFLASLHPRQALPLSGPLHPGARRAPGTAPLRSSSWASLINLPQLGQRALFACTAHPYCQNHESLLRKHQKFTLLSAREQTAREGAERRGERWGWPPAAPGERRGWSLHHLGSLPRPLAPEEGAPQSHDNTG